MKPKMNNAYPLSACGYQVFVGMAGLSALALIALWNMLIRESVHLQNYFPLGLWHAHEMLLGFGAAVIASLILAVPRNNPIACQPLFNLVLLWLYGRIVPFYAGLLANELIALIEVLFLPVLAYYVRPMLKQSGRQAWPYLLLLSGLTTANIAVHAEILGWLEHAAPLGLGAVLAVLIIAVLAFASDWLPKFTERALTGVICIRNPSLDLASVALVAVFWVAILIGLPGSVLALLALLAAVANAMRFWTWFDLRICYVPLLWVLYSAYVWILLGFVLSALTALGWVPMTLAVHAFAIGGVGVLSLGMMARLLIGQTSQSQRRGNSLAISFLLINLAALLLAVFPTVLPQWTAAVLWLSAYGWLAAFAVFMAYFLSLESAG